MCVEAVKSGLNGVSGVIGHDEEKKGQPMRAIEFPRIKGGKNFDVKAKWFDALLKDIGQPKGKVLSVKH
jgi:diphosphate-dependent phosphofructokinase